MSNLFEDYREIDNVRDKLDFVIDLVNEAPRRVFLTKDGKVQAIVIGPGDYTDLWNIELERDMKLGDEEEAEGLLFSTEEVMGGIEDLEKKLRERRQ